MIIHTVLLIYLLVQPQTPSSQVSSELTSLLQTGAGAQNRGDLDAALCEFKRATELAPTSAVAFLKLGEAYLAKGEYGAAVPPLRRMLELNPDSVPGHQFLGYALLAQGYASEAIPYLEFVHDPAALGIAELETDQPAEAVVHLKDALAKTPNDPDLIYYLGRAASALSSVSQERLLSEFAQSARTHQTRGLNYYAAKMYPEAETEYKQAIALRPNLPGLRLELGEIYAAGSHWVEAEDQFRAETKIQPGSAEAAYRLGDALLHQGNLKEAADELRRSDSLRPQMPETLYALGRALAINDPDTAAHIVERVVLMEKQNPLAGQAYLLLASIHRKQGRGDAAAHDMREYKRIQNLASTPGK